MDKNLKKTPQIDAEFFLCEVLSVISQFIAIRVRSPRAASTVHYDSRYRFSLCIMRYAYAL